MFLVNADGLLLNAGYFSSSRHVKVITRLVKALDYRRVDVSD